MKRLTHWITRRRTLGLLVFTLALLGLQGCTRGGWHGRHDPARFEERMTDVQAEIADELKLQPHQQAPFDALMARYKELAREWRSGWRATAETAFGAVEQSPADAPALGEALKQRFRQRPDDATIDQLIDDTVAFYQSLEPQQQEEVREHLAKHLRRFRG